MDMHTVWDMTLRHLFSPTTDQSNDSTEVQLGSESY